VEGAPNTGYAPPSKGYLPPTLADGYLPPPHHKLSASPGSAYAPPSKEYLPPTLSDGYLPPPHRKPAYSPPPQSGLPPTLADGYLPPKHQESLSVSLPTGYQPPQSGYLPPLGAGIPSQEYLPPPPPPEFIPAIDEEISNLLSLPLDDYLPPPPRGPQYPVEEVFNFNNKAYVPPPPRNSDSLTIPDIVNGHLGDLGDGTGKEHYIPPKTLNDVPKNFIRPEDLPEPPELNDILDIEVSVPLIPQLHAVPRTMVMTLLMTWKSPWRTLKALGCLV
jgi:hypothetical protein